MSDDGCWTALRAGQIAHRCSGCSASGLVVLAMVLLGGCSMRQMIYPAPGVAVGAPPTGVEEVALRTPEGATIVAWHWPGEQRDGGDPVLLFLHGNGENLETMRSSGSLAGLTGFGSPFLVIDYPGYGRSTGVPTEETVKAAAEGALAWVLDQYPERPQVVVGWSLGAAVAIHLAAGHEAIDGLIALSPWTSLSDVAAIHFPAWLTGLLLRESYDSVSLAGQIRCPSLLIHGARDRIIPVNQGRRLQAALPSVEMVEIEAAGHNDLLADPDVWERMARFLAVVGRRTAV